MDRTKKPQKVAVDLKESRIAAYGPRPALARAIPIEVEGNDMLL